MNTPKAEAAAAHRINPKLVNHVDVKLEAILGEARMTISDLLSLKPDSVVPLEAGLGQRVELRLNGVPVATGELVAAGDRFGVRLIEMSE